MKRNSASFRNSGAFTSPGTPEYGDNNVGELPKTWHSERVPLSTNTSSSRRHIGAAALMPFNNGRALPSKWDDAERWITSPISGFSGSFAQPQRRPKSKSGPLAPQGLGYLSNYSPNVESGNARNFMGNSPLTTGVLVPDGLSIHYESGIPTAKTSSMYAAENNIYRSASMPGISDSASSVPSSQDEKFDGAKEDETMVSRVVSRRDMATQMSPSGSTNSSCKERLSFSALSSALPTSVGPPSSSTARDEIRDVQVDKGTTTSRPSKKQGTKKMKNIINVEDVPSSWNDGVSKNASRQWNLERLKRRDKTKVTERSLDSCIRLLHFRRLQREEAKINAWENLQKAKAEAAIKKLEMKLEKKRSSSMDKIMKKLRAAQMKAETMRESMSVNPGDRASRTSRRRMSCCIYVKIQSLGNCFVCHRD